MAEKDGTGAAIHYFKDDHDRVLRVRVNETGEVRVNVLIDRRGEFTWWVYRKTETPILTPIFETAGYNRFRDIAKEARCPLFQRQTRNSRSGRTRK